MTIAKGVDSHAHVFCASNKYAFAADREYTPHPTQLGTPDRFAAVLDAHGLTNGLCVWGSDWPWVRMDERMDYGPVYACLERWLPDPNDRRKVLWETPSRLFGFA